MPLTDLGFSSIVTKSGTYTAATYDDQTLLDATSASFTVNLPTAAVMTGRTLKYKKLDSSVNTITIDGFGSETINGSTAFVLTGQDQELDIKSDGTNWIIASPFKLFASVTVLGPTLFTTTSTSYVAISGAQYATKTLAGGAQNPGTVNDLSLKMAYLPKGTYRVMCWAVWGNATSGSSVNAKITDGTNTIGQEGTGNATNAAAFGFGGVITYSTDQSNITFSCQGKVAGAATFEVGGFNGSSLGDVSIELERLN